MPLGAAPVHPPQLAAPTYQPPTCPITMQPFIDPVITVDGHTYERAAIETWLIDHDTSPLTGLQLPHKHLIPNFALRPLQ